MSNRKSGNCDGGEHQLSSNIEEHKERIKRRKGRGDGTNREDRARKLENFNMKRDNLKKEEKKEEEAG